MAFLDDLGDFVRPITDKSKEVATKAKELTETLQIKSQINAERTMMEEAYQSIGRAYYDSHAQCENPAYEDAYLVIEHCRNQIAELEEKLHVLSGSRICPHCGARVNREFGFCGKCGAPMERPCDSGRRPSEEGAPDGSTGLPIILLEGPQEDGGAT